MSLFLHLRDKVFRVRDQGVLPVPLDPDLLFLAENAKQSNIIQQLYRTQMERNRSRGPFGDAFVESEHPRGQPGNAGQFAKGGSSVGKEVGREGREAAKPAGARQGRASSPEQAQGRAKEAASGRPKLEGLPDQLLKLGDSYFVPGPLGRAHEAAEKYMKSAGMEYQPLKRYRKVDAANATRVADAFEQMKHDPEDPKVKEAYEALAKEVMAQWKFVKETGLKVQWIKADQEDPYAESLNLVPADVRENNHIWGFPTEVGYGTNDPTERHNNPMLQPTDEVIDGHKCLVNDIFRIVHDYFGHIKDGVGFTDDGEENSWRSHATMFTPLARAALTSETRGQASWVNHGPHGEKNRTASAADIEYAPQKIGLMPPWTWEEGEWRDAEWEEHKHPRDEDGKFKTGQGAVGKVPSAAPVGAPPAKQPEPSPSGVSLEEVTGQLSPLMGRHGYKFSKYEESSGQVTYVHANGSEVKFDKVRARWEWQYRSPEGKKRAGGSMLDLKEVLESGDFGKPEPIKVQPSTEQVLKKLPKSLKDQLQISNYIYREAQNLGTDMARYVFYDPRKYGNRIEYGVENWGEGNYWEHVDAEHERRYWGYGNLSLIGHMKRYEKGEVFDSKFAKDFGDKLFSNVSISGGSIFQPIIEGDTAVVFRNGYGDDIFIYKDYDKATLDTAKWKIMMSHEDGDKRPYNEGTGWEELKANLSSLEDDRATENARAKVERDEHHARLNEIGRSVIKRLGYDPDRLIVTDEDHEFMLNGSKHFAGGTHWADGRIMLHAKRLKNLSSTVIEGLVAHETMHEKFQRVMEEYKEERAEIREDKRKPAKASEAQKYAHQTVMTPEDLVREEFVPDYPVYAKLEPVLGYASNLSAELAKTDGVTPYSRQYWEEYQSGAASWKQGGGLQLAINETLAEMANLEVTDPAQFKTIAKPWRDLYRNMVTFYRERNKRRAFKTEHAEERASWRAKKEELPIAASPEIHPAVTQLAHALHQVLNLGDKAWNKADHPQAPEGAPEGKGGQFVSKAEAGGGGTEPSKQTESRKKSEFPQIKAPVTNTALPGNAKGSHEATISSRVPTTKGATDDKYRRADVTAMRENDEAFDHNTALFDDTENYPNFRPGELDCPPARGDASDCADRRVGIIMRHMKKNLKFLYDNAPKEVREQGHKWYEGAHDLAAADAKKYGLPLPSVVGAYAALSPQTLWDLNVHLAKTVLDVYHTKQDFKWDKAMEDKAQEIWSDKNKALLSGVRDKKLSELTDQTAKAMWIRTYDEAYNKERSFSALSPDGRVIGTYKNLDGSDMVASWNSIPPIVHAIMSIESGGDRNILSPAMGSRHKVRSFYNNILDPDSDNKDVTIDTHAVGAALLRALGGKHTAVMHSFGKGPSTKAESERIHYRGTSSKGVSTQGLYAIYADAYRSLAKELGIKPRVLQSITWEAKRRLFDERMTDEAKESVEEAWRKYHNDKASLEETQKAIVKAAGGFSKGQEQHGQPERRSSGEVSAVDRRTGDSRKLDRAGVRSQPARSVDTGGRGYGTRGVAIGARRIWANARLAVLLR